MTSVAFDSLLSSRKNDFAFQHSRRQQRRLPLLGRLDEAWPLQLFFYGYPLWWVLGLSNLIHIVIVVPMVWYLIKHRDLRVPRGFGFYLLFLAWAALGVFMLYVRPPGTEAKSGLGPLVGFGFRSLWYLVVTVACLYVLNFSRTRLSAVRLSRMLAFLFLVTVAGGYLGLLFPRLDFPSALELVLPSGFTNDPFMNALFHPRVSQTTEFLGFEQTRVTAPYPYPNSWGNAFGVLVPFFIYAWFGKDAGWRRMLAPIAVVLAAVPAVYSLNRGLWLGLAISAAWIVLRKLLTGDMRALVVTGLSVAGLLIALLLTPLGNLITVRLDTPHSDDRRQDTATTVIRTTWENSPILGFGSTRQMVGNFDSLAGGALPGCHQCAAPPLGTQGLLWGLIFMTGFVGALLILGFLFYQWQLNARRTTTVGLLTSVVLMASVFYFLVYDSLDLPFMVTMMLIGLSSRDHSPSPLEESTE
jgi:hypothetical protein